MLGIVLCSKHLSVLVWFSRYLTRLIWMMIASFLLLNLNTWYQRRRILSSKVQMSPLAVYNSRSGTLCIIMAEALSGAPRALKNKLHHSPHERFLTNIYSNNNTLELSLDWNLVISTTWKCRSITFIWMVADKCFVHGIKVCYLNNHTLRFLTQVKLEFPVTAPHVQN